MKDYVAMARQYEDDVLSGRQLACKWVKLACARNQRDRQRQRTAAFPFYFDEGEANKICAALEGFPHIKGPQAKIVGRDDEGRFLWQTISAEPWQCWSLTTAFGWKRESDSFRRFRTVLILVPRKNAKSTTSAVVLLYGLGPDGESGAECYSAATTKKQAGIVTGVAQEMARRTPQFVDFFDLQIKATSIELPLTASKLEAVSAQANTLDGLNVHIAVVDELHAHRTREVWDVLETATGARRQPLIWAITTAGVNTGGICYEQLTYLQKVLEGVLEDETYFGINYTIDEGDDWRTEESWRKANPNYGISVSPDDLARKSNKAKHSPASINNFLTKHLNVWVRAESTWMPMENWKACGDPALRIEDFKGAPCWIGVDLAEVRDIAALVALFRPAKGRYVMFGRFYLPEQTVAQSPIAQYSGWVHQKRLIATDGNVTDYQRIEDDIADWCSTYRVREIDFDRALAQQMGQHLQTRLGSKIPVTTVDQNVKVINPAMQLLERLVMERNIGHDGDPCMTWMMSNVVVQRNYKDEIYPRKAGGKDSYNKIDGPVALLTCLSQASLMNDEPPKRGKPRLWTPGGFVPASAPPEATT